MIAFGPQPGAPQATASPAPGAPVAFGAPAAAAAQPLGVSVPVELKGGDGSSVTVEILFGPEHAASAAALMNLVQSLFATGFPVRVYRPKPPGGFGGGGFGGGFSGGRRW